MTIQVASRARATLNRTTRGVSAPLFCAGMNLPFISDSGGITVTASATPHTKGAWAQLVASTSSTSAMALITASSVFTAATDSSTLLEIGVGGAGSESVIVPNVAVGGHAPGPAIWIPVRIPSGSRVAARVQSAIASKAPQIRIYLFSHADSARCPTSLTAIGANTGTSAGVAMSGASGTWVEITSATTADFQALSFVPSCSATAGNNGNWRFALGIGAAGSEVELSSYVVGQTGNPLVQVTNGDAWFPCPVGQFIPTGTRIAVKHNITSNPGRLSAMVLGVPTV